MAQCVLSLWAESEGGKKEGEEFDFFAFHLPVLALRKVLERGLEPPQVTLLDP
jgi:hypothetical protein